MTLYEVWMYSGTSCKVLSYNWMRLGDRCWEVCFGKGLMHDLVPAAEGDAYLCQKVEAGGAAFEEGE